MVRPVLRGAPIAAFVGGSLIHAAVPAGSVPPLGVKMSVVRTAAPGAAPNGCRNGVWAGVVSAVCAAHRARGGDNRAALSRR